MGHGFDKNGFPKWRHLRWRWSLTTRFLMRRSVDPPVLSGAKKTMFIKADPCADSFQCASHPFRHSFFSHIALERCHNITRLFSRFVRLIKEGGQVYFEMAGAKDMEELYQVIVEVAKQNEFARHFGVFQVSLSPAQRANIKTHFGGDRVSVKSA